MTDDKDVLLSKYVVIDNTMWLSFFPMITGSERKFTMDASTGEIRTSSSPLDREVKSIYRMTAVASDPANRQVCNAFNLIKMRKQATFSQHDHCFSREMASEEQLQKFHTDELSLSKSW